MYSLYVGNPVFSEPSIVEAPRTTFVRLHQSASFTCTVSGNPQPNITWYKDGREILWEKLPQLRITEVDLGDRGAYHCTASSRESSVTSDPAFLNIMGRFCGTILTVGRVMLTLAALYAQLG